MKWISQFKISASLDARDTPDGTNVIGSRNAEGGQSAIRNPQSAFKSSSSFAQQMAHLHRQLKAGPPEPAVPPFLHSSIMEAVRADAGSRAPFKRRLGWWPAAAVASVLLAIMAIYFLVPRPVVPSPVRNLNQKMTALPSNVLSPLSDELQRLHRDLERTTQFLLASVPELETP